MLKEFKEFAMRGNVMDLAVAVIIGAAFGAIIKSVVDDLIMPVIAALIGDLSFKNLYIGLSGDVAQGLPLEEAKALGPVFAYGNFITVLIYFIILAFIIFLVVKAMNKLIRKKVEAPAVPPAPTKEEVLLTEMRDALNKLVEK